MKNILITGLLLGCSVYTFAQKANDLAKNINASSMRAHLEILASDSLEGRETGMKGQKMAAEYIENQFKKFGLKPGAGDGTYQQSFPIVVEKPGGGKVNIEGNELTFIDDYFYLGSYPEQSISFKSLVFVGYGIEDEKWNDYSESIDLKDKLVVMLSGEPKADNGKYVISGEDFPGEWSRDRFKKIKLAQEKGAKSVIIITEGYTQLINGYKRYLLRKQTRLVKENERKILPFFYVNDETVPAQLNAKLPNTIAKYIKKGKLKMAEIPTNTTLSIIPDVKELNSENVLGLIEGTDKKDEYVVITGHYDHLGIDGDKIYNGADDDGSGTTTVLALAEAFAAAKDSGFAPRRSILFMTVSGEEKGLLGSEYYTDHPVYPLENTVCNLNIDMVGRLDEKHADNPNYVYLIGSDKLSTELHQLSELANKESVNIELDYTYNDPKDPNRYYYRSDHYNFAKNNIPVIFYFNGTHDDYHKETDTVEKINFEKMEAIGRLVFHTAWKVANRDGRLKVDVENDFSNDR